MGVKCLSLSLCLVQGLTWFSPPLLFSISRRYQFTQKPAMGVLLVCALLEGMHMEWTCSSLEDKFRGSHGALMGTPLLTTSQSVPLLPCLGGLVNTGNRQHIWWVYHGFQLSLGCLQPCTHWSHCLKLTKCSQRLLEWGPACSRDALKQWWSQAGG